MPTPSRSHSIWYRQIPDRIKATHRAAAPRVLRVTLLGAAVSGLMLGANWVALGWLAATWRMDLAIAATAAIAVRTSTGALTSLVMAAGRLGPGGDPRRERHLHLPRRRDPGSRRCQPHPAPRRTRRPGRREQQRQDLFTGLRTASSGTVTWHGIDLSGADPHSVWGRVGLVPQDYTRWPMDLRANAGRAPARARE